MKQESGEHLQEVELGGYMEERGWRDGLVGELQ